MLLEKLKKILKQTIEWDINEAGRPEATKFTDSEKKLLMGEVDGYIKHKKKIALFEIANSDCYIELEKDKWKPTLETALQYYVEQEEYDVWVGILNLH